MKIITKVFRKRKNTWFVLPIALLFAFNGCHNRHIDPQNPILGKWVLIQSGGDRVKWKEVHEYLPDSTVRFYHFGESHQISGNEYRLNDTILYSGYFSNDRFSGNAYRYQFFDKNRKLRLVPDIGESTIINFVSIPTTVYQRIK